MPSKKSTTNYTEDDVSRALQAVRDGLSLGKASEQFCVPKTTLLRRLKNPNPIRGRPTILSRNEEAALAEWMSSRAASGVPVTRNEMRVQITNSLKKIGKRSVFKRELPSKTWCRKMEKRNHLSIRSPEIPVGKPGITEEGLREWFSHVEGRLNNENALEILQDGSRIWNADEIGIAFEPDGSKVTVPKNEEEVRFLKHGANKRAVTILAAVSASGCMIEPYLVYPYVRIPAALRSSVPNQWGLANSKKGWMSEMLFLDFLKNHFVPKLQALSIKFPIIFFVDGVSNHVSIEASEFCKDNGIILFSFPPNASHFLQPCDMSVFEPLKASWFRASNAWMLDNPNSTITKQNFATRFKSAWDSIDPSAISNSFQSCGLYPWNPDAIDYSQLSVRSDSVGAMPISCEFDLSNEAEESSDKEDICMTPDENQPSNSETPDDIPAASNTPRKSRNVSEPFDHRFRSAMEEYVDQSAEILFSMCEKAPLIALETILPANIVRAFRATRAAGKSWAGDPHWSQSFMIWLEFSKLHRGSTSLLNAALPK